LLSYTITHDLRSTATVYNARPRLVGLALYREYFDPVCDWLKLPETVKLAFAYLVTCRKCRNDSNEA